MTYGLLKDKENLYFIFLNPTNGIPVHPQSCTHISPISENLCFASFCLRISSLPSIDKHFGRQNSLVGP